jgi:hypothetical protein
MRTATCAAVVPAATAPSMISPKRPQAIRRRVEINQRTSRCEPPRPLRRRVAFFVRLKESLPLPPGSSHCCAIPSGAVWSPSGPGFRASPAPTVLSESAPASRWHSGMPAASASPAQGRGLARAIGAELGGIEPSGTQHHRELVGSAPALRVLVR